MFLTCLTKYSDIFHSLRLEVEVSVPMVLVEDFNIFENDQDKLKEYLRKHYNWKLKNYPTERIHSLVLI